MPRSLLDYGTKKKRSAQQLAQLNYLNTTMRQSVKFKNSELDRQLDLWRSIDENVAIKARVTQKATNIAAIKGAIHRFRASDSDFRDLQPPRKNREIDSDQSEDA